MKFMSSIIIIKHDNHNNIQNKKINSKIPIHTILKLLLFLFFYDNTNYTDFCTLTGIIYKMIVVLVAVIIR